MIKICGITNLSDARVAVECGADALGFVMAPSARRVAPAVARYIASDLPGGVLGIGVFVDEPLEIVREVASWCGFDMVQLHGREEGSLVTRMGAMAIKSVFTTGGCLEPDPCDYPGVLLLIDMPRNGSGGKAGGTCDWGLAAGLSAERPVIVAGGLDPDNVAEAIRLVRPAGVDVCGGVESSPGRKDHERLAQFIERAREGGV